MAVRRTAGRSDQLALIRSRARATRPTRSRLAFTRRNCGDGLVTTPELRHRLTTVAIGSCVAAVGWAALARTSSLVADLAASSIAPVAFGANSILGRPHRVSSRGAFAVSPAVGRRSGEAPRRRRRRRGHGRSGAAPLLQGDKRSCVPIRPGNPPVGSALTAASGFVPPVSRRNRWTTSSRPSAIGAASTPCGSASSDWIGSLRAVSAAGSRAIPRFSGSECAHGASPE
jgi:hypothetical protein